MLWKNLSKEKEGGKAKMAANLNKVLIMGNLTRDPELKYVPSGTAVASFGLAANRTYTDSNGERQEDTCFVDIVAWNRLAEVCGDYLTKGKPVFVEGRLQYHSWESEDGGKRSKLEVVAQNIQFLGATKADGSEGEEKEADVPF